MKGSKPLQEKFGKLLQTNKFAIFLEIVVVFLPFYLGLAISDRLGSDQMPLGGNVVIIGGPIIYLGLIISLLFLWVTSRLRGASWGYFGLTRPKSWFRTVLMSLGVALAVLGTVVLIINPIMNSLPNLPPQDLSRFDPLTDSLPNLIIQLVIVWITAAFLEEFMFRGYLMNRIIDLQGKETKIAWAIAIVGQAVIFGLIHSQQGPGGMFKVGAIGLVFGLSYLAVGRNLWPLILAHGIIDTIDMVQHYFGG
jgi:membrane protease YdiL (CAAX protease family)